MPYVKIDMIKGVRSPIEIKKLADIVQEVVTLKFGNPPSDRYVGFGYDMLSLKPLTFHSRYQIITQHEPYEIICGDTNLGFSRTNKLVFIQFFQLGNGPEKKQALYAEMQTRLENECGVLGTDLIMNCSAVAREDWSLGMGRAQYMNGDL